MSHWPQFTSKIIHKSRRNWFWLRYIAEQAAETLPDASALFEEIDESFDEMERIHSRLRHQVRRLEHKLSSQPISKTDREHFFKENK